MSHTFQHRLNALLTFAVTTLAVLCLLASITDEFHRSDPVADVRVLEIERFARVDRNDEAYLVFSVDADLRSCFSWNTKQLFVSVQAEYEIDHPQQGRLTNVVSIWDRVVESKEKAVLRVPRARKQVQAQGSRPPPARLARERHAAVERDAHRRARALREEGVRGGHVSERVHIRRAERAPGRATLAQTT
jgi:signal peptidase complex subunit 3